MTDTIEIITLRDRPEVRGMMANWFHERWHIPLEAYTDSMEQCLSGSSPIPQWYAAMDSEIMIGGLGVIEMIFIRDMT